MFDENLDLYNIQIFSQPKYTINKSSNNHFFGKKCKIKENKFINIVQYLTCCIYFERMSVILQLSSTIKDYQEEWLKLQSTMFSYNFPNKNVGWINATRLDLVRGSFDSRIIIVCDLGNTYSDKKNLRSAYMKD